MYSYGYIEVIGLVTAVQAADAALKAADVEIVCKENPGAGMIVVVITGEISAVNVGIEAAKNAAERIGKVVSTNVLASQDRALEKLYS